MTSCSRYHDTKSKVTINLKKTLDMLTVDMGKVTHRPSSIVSRSSLRFSWLPNPSVRSLDFNRSIRGKGKKTIAEKKVN